MKIFVLLDFEHTEILLKLLKFGLVGISGMLIDFSITWFFKEKLRLNKYLANTAGFSFAVISNFIFNYRWTFAANSNVSVSLLRFFLIALAGLAINNTVIWFFNDRNKINFYLSKAFAIAVVFIWNFGLNYLYNFHSR
jgi:putative flippase GtrA